MSPGGSPGDRIARFAGVRKSSPPIMSTGDDYGVAARGPAARLENPPCGLPFRTEDPQDIVHAVAGGLSRHTRVVFFSHVTSTTGLVMPAEKLCKLARGTGRFPHRWRPRPRHDSGGPRPHQRRFLRRQLPQMDDGPGLLRLHAGATKTASQSAARHHQLGLGI